MTSSIQPTISPNDRVAPQRAAKPGTSPRRPASKPSRRPWLAATILSVGTLAVVGGGFAAYQMVVTGEVPKPRMAAIKLGPLPDMPDLRDGVPALMPKRGAAPAPQQAASLIPPPTAEIEDANRKAMASTVAEANLRPAIAASVPSAAVPSAPVPSVRAQAEPPKAAAVSASAGAAITAAAPAPVRQVEAKRPTETASIVDAKAPVASPAPNAAAPAPAAPAPAPPPAEAARDPAPAAQPRMAALPAEAPLPPRKPSLQAPEPSADRAAERAPSPKPRPVATQTRPAPTAPQQTVASAQEVRAPAPTPTVEEDRSILGVPVPRFVPTGRDIRDAAATVGNAITSIPDHF